MANGVRMLADPGARVETGPTQFGDDWPGVFIRGDDCAYFAITIRTYLGHNPAGSVVDSLERIALERLAEMLEASRVG